MKKVYVKDIVKFAKLDVLAGEAGLNNLITDDEITTPAVELAGFFDYFDSGRVIVVGSKEANFLHLHPETERDMAEGLFKRKPRAIVFSRNVAVPDYFIEFGNKYEVAILKSDLRTSPLASKLFVYLRERLSEIESVHGVLVDINGMGTLILGKSGIGKSEIALELIRRGHQLIADDLVEIYEREVGTIVGRSPETIKGYLEVRGVGIINVIQTFGIEAYREDKTIRLVIQLEDWEDDRQYDRLGIDNEMITYFHTELPLLTIPVKTGRNMAVVIEGAAMNQKLKYFGYNSSLALTKKISEMARKGDGDDD